MQREARQPNIHLRHEREIRNWTLKDVERELRVLMASRGETQVGISLNSVSRWELGVRRPDMRYRRYLCLLYGKSPDQLGFLPRECRELAEAWPKEFSKAGVLTIIQPLPPDRRSDLALQPRQASLSVTGRHTPHFRLPEDDLEILNLTRRQLLAAAGYFGMAAGVESVGAAQEQLVEPLDRAARVASGRAAADDALIVDLDAFTDGLQRSTRRVAGELLIQPVAAHIDLVKSVLKQSLLPAQREALLRNASHATSIMASLHFFDRGDHVAARAWLTESIKLGEATADADMHVLGLIQAAQHSIYTSQHGKSVQLIQTARELAMRRCSPNTVSWTLALEAETQAIARQPQASSRLLGRAAEVQQRSQQGYEHSWTEHWDRGRLAGYIGAVNMRLEQPGPASAALHEALAELPPQEVKTRSICLVDLAVVRVQELEVEAACELAKKALDIAGPMHYGTTLERMAGLRQRLGRWQSVRAVKDLDDRLHALDAPV